MGFLDRDPGRAEFDRLSTRVQLLEEMVAELARRGGVSVAELDEAAMGGSDSVAEIRLLKQQGKQIQAIKLMRERTGLGLKEAKDRVDAL